MKGLLVFKDLREALFAGFEVYDQRNSGYIVVRKRLATHFVLALARR